MVDYNHTVVLCNYLDQGNSLFTDAVFASI